MKTINLIFLILLINNYISAQCKQQTIYCCASRGASEMYLKDFNTKLQGEEIKKFYFDLKKGTRYGFSICTDDTEQNIRINLYNSSDSLLMTTDRNVYDFISFGCKNTDTYYITLQAISKVKQEPDKKRRKNKKTEHKADKVNAVCVLSFLGKDK